MVLVGQVQRELVGLVNEHGPLAVGLSGEDAGLFTAKRTNTVVDGEEVDLGLVGEVARGAARGGARPRRGRPHPGDLQRRARQGRHRAQRQRRHRRRRARGRAGRREAAGAHRRRGPLPRLARQRRRDRRDQPRGAGRADADPRQRAWCPKMGACLQAVSGGVPRATVVDGREPHAVLLELFTDEGVGTQVLPGVATKIRKATRGSEAVSRPTSRSATPPSLMNTFGPPQLVLTRGEGAHVWDEDGTRVRRPARRHRRQRPRPRPPGLVEAVTRQLADPRPRLELLRHRAADHPGRAARSPLLGADAPGGGKVFFTNSGAEANEAAFKLTRRTGRTHLVAAEGAFHGRTMGALALTSKAAYREPFEPLPGRRHLRAVRRRRRAGRGRHRRDRGGGPRADPGRGRRGRAARRLPRRRPPDHPRARRAAVARRGADRHRAHRRVVRAADRPPSVAPDVVTVAKGLGGGIPIGACIGLGGAGRPAPARQPRHDLRRQPGRLRRRPRRARHDRGRRPARPRHRARRAAARRARRRRRGSPRCAAAGC